MTHCKCRTAIFRALLRGNYEEPGGPFGWFRAQPFPLDRPLQLRTVPKINLCTLYMVKMFSCATWFDGGFAEALLPGLKLLYQLLHLLFLLVYQLFLKNLSCVWCLVCLQTLIQKWPQISITVKNGLKLSEMAKNELNVQKKNKIDLFLFIHFSVLCD